MKVYVEDLDKAAVLLAMYRNRCGKNQQLLNDFTYSDAQNMLDNAIKIQVNAVLPTCYIEKINQCLIQVDFSPATIDTAQYDRSCVGSVLRAQDVIDEMRETKLKIAGTIQENQIKGLNDLKSLAKKTEEEVLAKKAALTRHTYGFFESFWRQWDVTQLVRRANALQDKVHAIRVQHIQLSMDLNEKRRIGREARRHH